METKEFGRLYVVATPMGNYSDITARGREVLEQVAVIAAEDKDRTWYLLRRLGIEEKWVEQNDSKNERSKIRKFINLLKSGESVAIVTDAGTPCISDPGNVLIKAAIEENIRVVGIPGCCAAINALVVSGFDLSSFVFCGFFPRDNGGRMKLLKRMRQDPQIRTYVHYEAPDRILEVIDFLIENEAQCDICLSNDMTKLHERIFRGRPAKVREQLLEKGQREDGSFELKGEFVLVMEIDRDYILEREHTVTAEALLVDVMVRQQCTVREAIGYLMGDERNTYSKNELKSAGIALKKLLE